MTAMAMQAPQTEDDIEQFKLKQAEHKRRWTVGLVDPKGLVTSIVCGPETPDGMSWADRGFTPVEFHDGEQRLRKWASDQGWTMLQARCIEDGVPERYDMWVQITRAVGQGRKITFNREEVYPPSVIAQAQAGGTAKAKAQRFDPEKGFVDVEGDPETTEERRHRVGQLAPQLGLEVTNA